MKSAPLTTRGTIQGNTRLPEDDVKLTYSTIGMTTNGRSLAALSAVKCIALLHGGT